MTEFRKLHEEGCFVIPNPWDRGSAIWLAQLGFKALATTSAGFAFSKGLPDSVTALSKDEVLAHVADLVKATTLPVNADFQDGYAATAEGVFDSVCECIVTGVQGLSIEDATGDPAKPLYELSEAVERLIAAREAAGSVILTARAECFLTGHPEPLEEALKRLTAYAQAGADVLYAPGVRQPEDIRRVVEAVAPKPVNVLVPADWSLTVPQLAELGVRRISVGSALARVAWTAFDAAARTLAENGEFTGFAGLLTTGEISRRL